jgi:osmotically-inducible protein OsmY
MFNFFEKKDSDVCDDVINELEWDPSVTSSQLNVSCKGGVVTVVGTVPHYLEKIFVENAAQRVGGVRGVDNEIVVNLEKAHQKSDQDLAKAALNALRWAYSVPEKDIKLSVNNGRITLKGEMEWAYQKESAGKAVGALLGVRGVDNNLSVRTKVYSADIKTKIQAALKRSAEVEARDINVDVNGARVTLTGKVHSLHEYSDAGASAWNAPGVMSVENNIVIDR